MNKEKTTQEKIEELKKQMKENKKWGFFIHSPAGYGKTYLMQKYIDERNSKKFIMVAGEKKFLGNYKMINLGDLFDDLQLSIQEKRFHAKLDDIKKQELLFLDDLGAEKYSEFREEVLYKIIDYRYRNKKQTFITSNMTTSEVAKKYSIRLSSRILGMFLLIDFQGEDRRKKTKKEIIL